jgi:UDP-glucose 4-epimerase
MRVLVTGGAGFIGSYLIPKLLERGYEVVVFDVAHDPPSLDPIRAKIEYVRGDLASDSDIYRAMLSHQPNGIFHLGALLAGPCEENPIRGININFGSTQVLLDASLSLGVERFFMLSSISVFGKDAAEPVLDQAAKNPETVYGQTKLASEHLLHWYAKKHCMDTRALRFTWVFGPGRTQGITALYSSLLLDAIAKGESITIPNPEEKGDWLYIKDAIKAILAAWDAPTTPQRIYNIAGGVHSIREVVKIALSHAPSVPVKMEEGGQSLSPYPVAYDDKPARSELGWKPDYSIEAAVKEHLGMVSGRV